MASPRNLFFEADDTLLAEGNSQRPVLPQFNLPVVTRERGGVVGRPPTAKSHLRRRCMSVASITDYFPVTPSAKRKLVFAVHTELPIFSSSPNSSPQLATTKTAKRRAIAREMSSQDDRREVGDSLFIPTETSGSAVEEVPTLSTVLQETRAMRKENPVRDAEIKKQLKGIREDYAKRLEDLERKCDDREAAWEKNGKPWTETSET